MATCKEVPLDEILDASRNGPLTEGQAREIVARGPEVAVFAILELSKRLAEQQAKTAAESHQTPSTPSGMKPPCRKPPGKSRKKRPGAKAGHPGSRRATPERIDRKVTRRADRCPDRGEKVKPRDETRTRHTEDIPDIQPEVTEHAIHRGWCPKCKKRVEPVVPDAPPKSTLGNRALVLSAWPHYALGNTLSQIVEVFNIDRSRGSPALMKFFIEEFAGTLVTDFWSAYNAVVRAPRQTCLARLLRELEHTEKYKSPGKHWPEFAKKPRRLLGDAIRLWRKRGELPEAAYASRRDRIASRLQELTGTSWQDAHAKRLIKRPRRHQNDLFTFLDQPDVPFDNNAAERAIRPAVIIRENSRGNRGERGADCQAVLMSIFRALKQRGHDPIRTIISALATCLTTAQLPPLPDTTNTSDR